MRFASAASPNALYGSRSTISRSASSVRTKVRNARPSCLSIAASHLRGNISEVYRDAILFRGVLDPQSDRLKATVLLTLVSDHRTPSKRHEHCVDVLGIDRCEVSSELLGQFWHLRSLYRSRGMMPLPRIGEVTIR